MKEEENLQSAINAAWGLFEQTGNIVYYNLYRKLGGSNKKR